MFNNFFSNFFHRLEEEQYQQGCRDRLQGKLPQKQDSIYLSGYLSDRPRGLDDKIQYFSTLETYLEWKMRCHRRTS